MSAFVIARREFIARLRGEPPHLALFAAVTGVTVLTFAAAWLVSTLAPRQGPDTGWSFYLSSSYAWRTALGAHRGEAVFFVSQALAMLALLLGPIAACATFNRERDGKATESLLLTGASPSAIMFGKLGAATLRTLLVVAATVPALAIAWLYGGVPIAVAGIAAALIVVLALYSSAVGILMASLSRSAVMAVLWSYCILAVTVALVPALFIVLAWAGKPSDWLQPLYLGSPVLTLWLQPDTLAAYERALPLAVQDMIDAVGRPWQGLPLSHIFFAATTLFYVLLSGLLVAVSSVLLDPYHPLRALGFRARFGRAAR